MTKFSTLSSLCPQQSWLHLHHLPEGSAASDRMYSLQYPTQHLHTKRVRETRHQCEKKDMISHWVYWTSNYREGLSIAQHNFAPKPSINAASPHRENPRCMIYNTTLTGSIISGRSYSEDPFLHGMKSPNSYGVLCIIGGNPTNRDGDNVDAIGNGSLKCSKNVHVRAAWADPTYLVHGNPSWRHSPTCSPLSQAKKVCVLDDVSCWGGSCVGAMTLNVHRR